MKHTTTLLIDTYLPDGGHVRLDASFTAVTAQDWTALLSLLTACVVPELYRAVAELIGTEPAAVPDPGKGKPGSPGTAAPPQTTTEPARGTT